MPGDHVPRLRRTGRRATPWPVPPAGAELMVLGSVLLALALLIAATPLRGAFDVPGLLLIVLVGAVLLGTGAIVRRRSA